MKSGSTPDKNANWSSWGGRFQQSPAALALDYSASVDIDKKLADVDIEGSIAHANMLAAQGVITTSDAQAIVEGLAAIRTDIRAGAFVWKADLEDVHMNIEAELRARIGDAAGRLHTGRSRNDQVATDLRLWVRAAIDTALVSIRDFQRAIVAQAETHLDTLMPGYTHLQRAQPVRLAHHLLAWCAMLDRDHGRLVDARRRLNECPLGSGALAGTTFPLDREATAKALGFDGPTHNSVDAVSDRDFALESVSALALCASHLSRFGEELVLWSSSEFGFVRMSDAFTTGSSMMPQKKNPDMAELARGKTGRVYGALLNLLTLMKGLPLSYNRDMQEDKEPVFDAFKTVITTLNVLRECTASATFDREAMRTALLRGFVDATELADWLTARGVPFRDAHHVTGRLVHKASASGRSLSELSLDELQSEHAAFEPSVYEALVPETAVERRNLIGGPARAQVVLELHRWNQLLGDAR